LNVFENMHVGYISTACFADPLTLVTGGTDNVSLQRFWYIFGHLFIHLSFSLYVFGRSKMKRQQTLHF
jgi:hypothetical protein